MCVCDECCYIQTPEQLYILTTLLSDKLLLLDS